MTDAVASVIAGESRYAVANADVLDFLRSLPDGVVQCCVTSPPYWGLRDYGVGGQIGLEPTPEAYVARMVEVFREVRNVLRDDGTCWLNLGDSYAANEGQRKVTDKPGQKQATSVGSISTPSRAVEGLPAKNLIGIPWRVAFALQADGWYLRQDIIWHKPNPMPESVGDRCTKSHEYLFLLAKSERYYFDADAIAEPVAVSTVSRLQQPGLPKQKGSDRVPGKTNGTMKAVGNGQFRNKRSVWSINTKGYDGAHFATFPEALVKPCILAGAPVGGVVLDPFGGSGTTIAVAVENGRRGITCELNPAYCDLIYRRMAATTPALC